MIRIRRLHHFIQLLIGHFVTQTLQNLSHFLHWNVPIIIFIKYAGTKKKILISPHSRAL